MNVVLDTPSTGYAAGPHVFEFDVPAFREITVRLTRESWPAGDCGDARLVSPDGKAGRMGFAGGAYIPKGSAVECLETHAGFRFERHEPDGTVTVIEQPGGRYSLTLNLLQPLHTSVRVEVF